MSQKQVSKGEQKKVLAQKLKEVQRQRAGELVNMHKPEQLPLSPAEPDENQSPDDPTVLPEHESRPWPEQVRFFSGRYHVLFVIEQTEDGKSKPLPLFELPSEEEFLAPSFQDVFNAFKTVAQHVADAWGELIKEHPELQQSDTKSASRNPPALYQSSGEAIMVTSSVTDSKIEPKLVAQLLAKLNSKVRDAKEKPGDTKIKSKNIGVEKYFHPACVLLPNGIPVSFSLLLGGQKGRRGPLSDIPDTIKLLAISRVLQEEKPTELLSDADIAEGTAEELEKLGYEDVPLTDKKISAFRDRLAKQDGLETLVPEKLFPNQRTRGEIYAQAGLVEAQS